MLIVLGIAFVRCLFMGCCGYLFDCVLMIGLLFLFDFLDVIVCFVYVLRACNGTR